MTISLRHWGRLLAGLAWVALASPTFPADDPIRILFLAPRDGGVVDIHVSKLEQIVKDGRGPLAVVDTLTDAHVVLQFTDYRRTVDSKGQPRVRWIGQAKVLKPPAEMTVSQTPLPERFELVLFGDQGKQEARASARLLEQMLTKSFRPKAAKSSREAI